MAKNVVYTGYGLIVTVPERKTRVLRFEQTTHKRPRNTRKDRVREAAQLAELEG